MNKTLSIAALALCLTACATPRLEPVRVLSADADTIRVQWNSIEVSEAVARRVAVLHCGARRAQEVDTRSGRGWSLALLHTRSWRCVSA